MDLEHGVQLSNWFANLPLIGLMAGRAPEERTMATRIIEGILIAAATGAVTSYVSISTLNAVNSSQIQDIRQEIVQQHNDTMAQLTNIQSEINSLRNIDYSLNAGNHAHFHEHP